MPGPPSGSFLWEIKATMRTDSRMWGDTLYISPRLIKFLAFYNHISQLLDSDNPSISNFVLPSVMSL